ncbi:MAG TPA: DUF6152 family protein [Vicinamibacterales bacterium]|nr:DUF6152 family protein [Vicinamibacterales bacterium]
MKHLAYSLTIGLSAASAAHGHHSIAGVYDSSRPMTVAGRVTEFRFVNPHPILVIEVDAGTERQSWQLEMDNRFELADIGMSVETFTVGDEVVATGSLARTEPQRLYLRRLDRSVDGFRYEQVGSRPRVTRAAATERQ